MKTCVFVVRVTPISLPGAGAFNRGAVIEAEQLCFLWDQFNKQPLPVFMLLLTGSNGYCFHRRDRWSL